MDAFFKAAVTFLKEFLLSFGDAYQHRNDPDMPLIQPITTIEQPVTVSTSPLPFPPKIMAWAHIIEIEEGAWPSLNNPGNLKASPLTLSWGASAGRKASDGGSIAKFPTYQMGRDALCKFLVLGCNNQLIAFHQARTIEEFTKVYAGNPPQGYIDAIINYLGVTPETLIETFLT